MVGGGKPTKTYPAEKESGKVSPVGQKRGQPIKRRRRVVIRKVNSRKKKKGKEGKNISDRDDDASNTEGVNFELKEGGIF